MTLILPQRGRLAQAAAGGLTFVGAAFTEEVSISNTGNATVPTLTGGSRSTLAEGDLLLFAIGFVHTGNDENISATGYTELEDVAGNDTFDANLYVGYKVQGATPDTTIAYDIGTGSWGGIAQTGFFMFAAFAGAGTPTSNSATAANTGVPNPPSITPTVAGSYVVNFSVGCSGAGSAGGSTSNSSYDSVWGGITPVDNPYPGVGVGLYAWSSGAFDAGEWSPFSSTSVFSTASANVVVPPA